MTLAAVGFLRDAGQVADAEKLLAPLLADVELAKRGALWRLAAGLAEARDGKARQMECLERALDAEYRDLPEVVSLERLRHDYRELLGHYDGLTDAMLTLKAEPPRDFLAKVVRAADRWRSLDREAAGPCEAVARILQKLPDREAHELAWDYLTTPVGLRPNESGPWANLARALQRRGEPQRADQAFASAFAAEPTNAQLLWDRARNLRQAVRPEEARKLLRRLADGPWQPRFSGLQRQARWQLENP